MNKRLFSIFVLVCLICGLMCACDTKTEITVSDAVAVMMEDLGDKAESVGEPHIHTGTYENKDCYNIYITLDGESWVYVISTDGEILAKEPASHSH